MALIPIKSTLKVIAAVWRETLLALLDAVLGGFLAGLPIAVLSVLCERGYEKERKMSKGKVHDLKF